VERAAGKRCRKGGELGGAEREQGRKKLVRYTRVDASCVPQAAEENAAREPKEVGRGGGVSSFRYICC
jgi:hypothetical protein